MSVLARLDRARQAAVEIPFDDRSRLILVADCHRGDNSWADDFVQNQALMFFVLEHYYQQGFTYIELGDGDELFENWRFADIHRAHSHIFWSMRRFYLDQRLYLIWGNHDIERRRPETVRQTLDQCLNERTDQPQPLFPGIQVHQSLLLQHRETGLEMLLLHGHQADPISEDLWPLMRLLSRYVWRPLQLFGVRDPTRAARNYQKQNFVDRGLVAWVSQKKRPIVAGHTHRSRFPKPNDPPYFNVGSCVHPRCLTGIEIQDGQLALVKWGVQSRANGALYVERTILAGPRHVSSL